MECFWKLVKILVKNRVMLVEIFLGHQGRRHFFEISVQKICLYSQIYMEFNLEVKGTIFDCSSSIQRHLLYLHLKKLHILLKIRVFRCIQYLSECMCTNFQADRIIFFAQMGNFCPTRK